MARINFEDSIFKEQGFQDLMIEVRDRHKAKGIVIELWAIAQEFWFPNRQPIPMDRFKAAGLPEILFAPGGLCELRDGGVYAKGSEKSFQWLFDAQHAGQKSAEARRKKKGTAQPKKAKKVSESPERPSNAVERPSNAVERPSNDPEGVSTSLLSSLSSSLSSPSLSSDVARAESRAPTVDESRRTSNFIRRYCEAWKDRHGSNPPITGKDTGIAKRLAKVLPEEKLEAFLRAYFTMPDAYLVKSRHPLELFEAKLKEIAVFAADGSFVTRRQALQADDHASNMVLLEKVRRGEA